MRMLPQNTPIKDNTESVKTKHDGAKLTRTTGYLREARTREPNRPRHAAGDVGPAKYPGSATEPRRESPASRARRAPGNYTTTGRGFAERSRSARPRWVMIARASTAERSGSSAGACCFKNHFAPRSDLIFSFQRMINCLPNGPTFRIFW